MNRVERNESEVRLILKNGLLGMRGNFKGWFEAIRRMCGD